MSFNMRGGRLSSPEPPRRLRHEVRDGLAGAGFSLGAAIAITGALWALLRWAG